MADENSEEIIEQRLAENSSYFSSLLELIPAKYYFDDDDRPAKNKYHRNPSKKAPKQAIKENSKKAKRLKLDPSQNKTVSQIQAERAAKEKVKDELEGGKDGEDCAVRNVENIASTSLDDLKSKLEARIDELRKKRKSDTNSDKQHERPKKKSKKEVKQKTKGKGRQGEHNNNNPDDFAGNNKVLNEKGEIVFSKFDFSNSRPVKEPRHGSKVVKFKKLLAKAEGKQKKLQELKETDQEKAQEIKQNMAWKSAMQKAEGIKQRDDPKLLKKTLKKREKQKQKSRKEWKEREQNVKKRMDEKQKKRESNLKERKEKKLVGKKGKKKGRKPGF